MNIRGVFLCLLVFLIFCSLAEQKKKKKRTDQKKLREVCRAQRKAKSPGTALELHAYFDLRPRRKAFACLKVTTCKERPVCFVTTHPYLKSKSINDTTTWQELITFIQSDRKIEPIYDASMSGWNGDRYKALSQYVQNQPAIYRMCRHATIYRFVVNENITTHTITTNTTTFTNGNTSLNSSSSNPGNSSINPSLPAMTLCPLFKRKARVGRKRKGKSMRIKRVDRSKNRTSDSFLQCQGLNCPCVRICVGQGRTRQTFSDCSTFRIICTFNCGSDTIAVPKAPVVTKPTRRPTKRTRRPGRRKRIKKGKSRNKKNKNKKKPANT